MTIPANNLVFNSGPTVDQLASNTPLRSNQSIVHTSPGDNALQLDLGRTQAARLAESRAKPRVREMREANTKLQGLSIIESGWNNIKKLGRSVCLAGGWASASAAVVSLLFFNIKVLAVIFGIPSLLFLYTAASLGRDIKKDPTSGPVKDPLGALKKILAEPDILRSDPKFVVKTIQAVGDMKKNTLRSNEVFDRLEALRDLIRMEQAQLGNKDDEASLLHRELIEDYANEIEKQRAV